MLLTSLHRYFRFLTAADQRRFLESCHAELPKRPRLQLDAAEYERLCREVLERDHCQLCGNPANLHVHHVKPRSWRGHDGEENLTTVCSECHRSIRQG